MSRSIALHLALKRMEITVDNRKKQDVSLLPFSTLGFPLPGLLVVPFPIMLSHSRLASDSLCLVNPTMVTLVYHWGSLLQH